MKCNVCLKEFIPKQRTQKYCSMSCRNKNAYNKYRLQRLEGAKKRYYNNKKKYLKQAKKYYEKNKDNILKNINKKQRKIYMKKYQKENIEKLKKYNYQYCRNKFKTNVSYRILTNLRASFGHIMCNLKIKKCTKFLDIIGCTGKALKQHLEKQFKPGMSWENYGVTGWHIDHIIPVSAFDFTKKSQQLKAFNYTNLQPLWAKENQAKGAKYER